MSRERNDRGQFTEDVTPSDVLGVFDDVEGPVLTSGDVADRTDCSRDTARRKLDRLAERGLVESRETAGRVVYWRSDDPDGHAKDVEARPSTESEGRGTAEPVDPEDPIFVDRPTFRSGRGDLSETVDELLYGSDG